MINYQHLYQYLEQSDLGQWRQQLPQQLADLWQNNQHGLLQDYLKGVKNLPEIKNASFDLNHPTLDIQFQSTLSEQALKTQLLTLSPWRKGPFQLNSLLIDTEWRSDWKWHRLIEQIEPLKDRLVLDIGCGNGYHCWRMKGAGARAVIGIDPNQLFLAQFLAIQHFINRQMDVYHLPFGIEALPKKMGAFNSVFSMGVLYHRRSPIDHLTDLFDLLQKNGQLILETLIIDSDQETVLVPHGRYAQMRNVWFLPSIKMLKIWLKRTGFKNIHCIDVNTTHLTEQRTTDWMSFDSLINFLDPKDQTKTIEGYPAPKRAVFIANR